METWGLGTRWEDFVCGLALYRAESILYHARR